MSTNLSVTDAESLDEMIRVVKDSSTMQRGLQAALGGTTEVVPFPKTR